MNFDELQSVRKELARHHYKFNPGTFGDKCPIPVECREWYYTSYLNRTREKIQLERSINKQIQPRGRIAKFQEGILRKLKSQIINSKLNFKPVFQFANLITLTTEDKISFFKHQEEYHSYLTIEFTKDWLYLLRHKMAVHQRKLILKAKKMNVKNEFGIDLYAVEYFCDYPEAEIVDGHLSMKNNQAGVGRTVKHAIAATKRAIRRDVIKQIC